MPRSSNKKWDEMASPELENLQSPATAAATEPSSVFENARAAQSSVPRFGYRILVVDDEPAVRETTQIILEREGYEVLTAADGLEALDALSNSLPDLIISDLNMPRMTGFEFLAIVRARFPHLSTIAMSAAHLPVKNPLGGFADAFLHKGQFSVKELFQNVKQLLAASPIRSEREKVDVEPSFVGRDSAGYLVLTCHKCLRPSKLEAMTLDGGIHETICQSCRAPIKFEIDHEIEPLMKHDPLD